MRNLKSNESLPHYLLVTAGWLFLLCLAMVLAVLALLYIQAKMDERRNKRSDVMWEGPRMVVGQVNSIRETDEGIFVNYTLNDPNMFKKER